MLAHEVQEQVERPLELRQDQAQVDGIREITRRVACPRRPGVAAREARAVAVSCWTTLSTLVRSMDGGGLLGMPRMLA